MTKFNVYAIEMNGCDGINEVFYVAASNREEAINTMLAQYSDKNFEWRLRHHSDVMWLKGAVYEADEPCCIDSRLCKDDGTII